MEGGPGGPRLRLHRAAQHGSLPAGRPLRGKAARLPPAEGASDEVQGLKDLLDLRVILEGLADVLPSPEETRRTIMATFDRYGTHALPNPLPDPPEDWMCPSKRRRRTRVWGPSTSDAHATIQEHTRALRSG